MGFSDAGKTVLFFITAFTPLWCIGIIKSFFFFDNYFILFTLIIPIILCIWIVRIIEGKTKIQENISNIKIVKKKEISYEVIVYMFAYIPILIIDSFTYENIIIFCIILFTVGALYIKKYMLQFNPIIILKYKMYEVTDSYGITKVVISNFNIPLDKIMKYQVYLPNINIIINKEFQDN